MSRLNIKDKKVKYAVLAVLGLVIAALTQLPDDMVAQVIQAAPEGTSGSSEGIVGILGDLLKLAL